MEKDKVRQVEEAREKADIAAADARAKEAQVKAADAKDVAKEAQRDADQKRSSGG